MVEGGLRIGSLGGSGLTEGDEKSFSQSCVDDIVGLETLVEDSVTKENESSTLSRSRSLSASGSVDPFLSIGYV